MTTETKHEELRELHEAATPGPWCVEEPMDQELWIVQDGLETYDWYPLATCPWPDDGEGVPRKAVKANADLITHLRNNVEHYIAQDARTAELEAEVARLRELAKANNLFARHNAESRRFLIELHEAMAVIMERRRSSLNAEDRSISSAAIAVWRKVNAHLREDRAALGEHQP